MEKDYKHTMEYCGDWKKNTGALGFKMNNDYLFRALLQSDEEDRRSGLVLWARLFKAESWEELIMLANENPVVDQTVSSVWQLSQDRAIREQMQRREENEYFWESTLESMRRKVEEAEREAEERVKEAEKKAKEASKEAVKKAVAEKNLEIEELKKRIRELENR